MQLAVPRRAICRLPLVPAPAATKPRATALSVGAAATRGLGDWDSVIVRAVERSPPPDSAVPLVNTWRPVPTTEALLGDAESVIVRSVERSPPPLNAAPLVATCRPVPTTDALLGEA